MSDAAQATEDNKNNSNDGSGEGTSVDGQGSPAQPQKPTGNVQLLPLLKKFFKYSAASVAIWFTGYFNFSTAWVLIALFVYLTNNEYQKLRGQTREFLRNASKDEKAAVLASIEQLPSWVFFPDVEKAEWLNKLLKQMWPFIGEYVKDMLKTSVQPSVEASLPSTLKPFQFTKIDLGDNAPRIGGIKLYTENVKRDEAIMDLDLMYYSDCEITMSARGISAGIKDLMVHGTVRIHMCPLVKKVPIVGGMTIFFLNPPRVDFDLTNLANILDFPVLGNTLRSVIVEQIGNFMVLPNKIPVALTDLGDMSTLKYPIPQGVLRINMYQGRELAGKDFSLGRKTSDPYCKLYVGAQSFKTVVKKNTLTPVWNQYFEAVVDQKHGQFAEIEVFDSDPDKDDELGTTCLPIGEVADKGNYDAWLPLEGVKTGMVHVRALWMHLSKDPSDLDKERKLRLKRVQMFNDAMPSILVENKNEEGVQANENQLATALLLIHLDSAKQLPKRSKRAMSEPSPFAEVTVGKVVHKSHVKANTCNPTWEQNFMVLINDPLMQELEVKIKDGKKDDPLGDLVVPIKNVFSAKDMLVFERFTLRNSSHNAELSLRLCLRILTSQEPAEWARDEFELVNVQPKEEEKPEMPATPTAGDAPATDQATTKEQPSTKDQAKTKETPAPAASETRQAPAASDPAQAAPRQRKLSGGAKVEKQEEQAPLGRIQMTIRYSQQRQKLVLVVHKCVNLVGYDKNKLSDPYVKIYLMPDRSDKRKTDTVKDSLNPVYDETFEWSLTPEEMAGKSLEVSVKNENSMFSKSRTLMGIVMLDLSQLDLTSAITEWYTIKEPEGHEKSQ